MPRSPRPWFRFYVEAIHDRKLRRRPPAQRWLWVVVLAAARAAPVAGYLLIGERSPVEDADLTDLAALPLRDVRAGLTYFQESGMLTFDALLGAWFVTAWESRQFESDDVTARTSKHRSNGHRRNVPTSAVGTPPETETENRSNPLTPTADAVGEPVEKSERTPTPRRGMRGSGTTLAAASQLGRDSIGIDLDKRNAELARKRVGPYGVLEVAERDGAISVTGQGAML